MRTYEKIGVMVPDVYLPRKGTDMRKWSVIACDQFTSQPEYWKQVEEIVGDAPSTFHLVLPEVYLGKPEEKQRLTTIQQNMRNYLDQGILQSHEGMIYVERTVAGKTRKGVILSLDLEKYDFNKGSTSLIRATEGTILDRLPPRIKIRENAELELPHIMVLIDDPDKQVIEPLATNKESLTPLYDTDLMLGSGEICGWLIDDFEIEKKITDGLEKLMNPTGFKAKYDLKTNEPVLLFAMGDGNHSLATAKAIWEKIKGTVGKDHPARYALVEIENVHDSGLEFEPIHRVLFKTHKNVLTECKNYFQEKVKIIQVDSVDQITSAVKDSNSTLQQIGVVHESGFYVLQLDQPLMNLAVGNLQAFLDKGMKEDLAEEIDYVHGKDVVLSLGKKSGNIAFYLPCMGKDELFRTVILDGALPRKTFSMGEAVEKRFYIESRKIK